MATLAELAYENRILREAVTKLKTANAKLLAKGRDAAKRVTALTEELQKYETLVSALPLTERRRLERKLRR